MYFSKEKKLAPKLPRPDHTGLAPGLDGAKVGSAFSWRVSR